MEDQMVLEHSIESVRGEEEAMHRVVKDSFETLCADRLCVQGYAPRRKVRRPDMQRASRNFPPTSLLSYARLRWQGAWPPSKKKHQVLAANAPTMPRHHSPERA
jgi:hypothetical protein